MCFSQNIQFCEIATDRLPDLVGGYAEGKLLDKDSMAVHGDASAGDHGFSVGNR